MYTAILMDDTSTPAGSMASGCGTILTNHGFECIYENGRQPTTQLPVATAAAAGAILKSSALRHAADVVVLDIFWGEDAAFDGFDIWEEAKSAGFALNKNLVVFVTQHRHMNELASLATEHGFDPKQVHFKNAQGNEAAARWLCEQLGIKFRPKRP